MTTSSAWAFPMKSRWSIFLKIIFPPTKIYLWLFINSRRNSAMSFGRSREFLMKDMYSFHKDEKDMALFYEKAKGAYKNIFQRSGIGELTYPTFASGGVFSKYSHE